MKTEETAWLIERESEQHPGCTEGLCFGVTDRGKISNTYWRGEWTTPHFALRFARKEDAEAAARMLCSDKTIAVGHIWDREQSQRVDLNEQPKPDAPSTAAERIIHSGARGEAP